MRHASLRCSRHLEEGVPLFNSIVGGQSRQGYGNCDDQRNIIPTCRRNTAVNGTHTMRGFTYVDQAGIPRYCK
jgi:hypothetical protein